MIKKGLAVLIQWLERRGYEVSLNSNTNAIDPQKMKVSICNASPLHVLYTLAHEAGHEVLFMNPNYDTKFKSVRYAEERDGRHGKSKLYRFKKLTEEINAWEEGYKLLDRLGVKLNKVAYDTYAAKSVNTYIKYLATSTGPTG